MDLKDVLNAVRKRGLHTQHQIGSIVHQNHGRNLVQGLKDIRDSRFTQYQGTHEKSEGDVKAAKEWADRQKKTREHVEAYEKLIKEGNEDRAAWVKTLIELRNYQQARGLKNAEILELQNEASYQLSAQAIDVKAETIEQAKLLSSKYMKRLGGA